jgi:hypothetical protein
MQSAPAQNSTDYDFDIDLPSENNFAKVPSSFAEPGLQKLELKNVIA